jgi:hypothetical protein
MVSNLRFAMLALAVSDLVLPVAYSMISRAYADGGWLGSGQVVAVQKHTECSKHFFADESVESATIAAGKGGQGAGGRKGKPEKDRGAGSAAVEDGDDRKGKGKLKDRKKGKG